MPNAWQLFCLEQFKKQDFTEDRLPKQWTDNIIEQTGLKPWNIQYDQSEWVSRSDHKDTTTTDKRLEKTNLNAAVV